MYQFFKAKSVIDFSAGWGDRLFAASALDIKYLGFDPNYKLQNTYHSIIKEIGNKKKQDVIISGAEHISENLLEKSKNNIGVKEFDLLFTSPPYYDYEIYNENNQSINNYRNSFEDWLVFFIFYVLVKFTPHIKKNGHVVLYIEDVGNNNYVEPIILFLESFYKELGVEYKGIISSNRHPFIIFQKTENKSHIYTNKYNEKKYDSDELLQLLNEHYPHIYKNVQILMNNKKDKILDLNTNSWKFKNTQFQETYFTINVDYLQQKKETYIFDLGINSSLYRTFIKMLIQLPKHITTLIYYGSKNAGIQIYNMALLCKWFNIKLIYYVKKNEIVQLYQKEKKDTIINFQTIELNSYLQKAKEELNLKIVEVFNTPYQSISVLSDKINKDYNKDNNIKILDVEIFDNKSLVIESIRELLLKIPINILHQKIKINSKDVLKYDGTIFLSITSAKYLQALYTIFPYAKFFVGISGYIFDENEIQLNRTKIQKLEIDNSEIKKYTKEMKKKYVPFLQASIYPYYKKYKKNNDICFLYN
jgi:hypothetical protein